MPPLEGRPKTMPSFLPQRRGSEAAEGRIHSETCACAMTPATSSPRNSPRSKVNRREAGLRFVICIFVKTSIECPSSPGSAVHLFRQGKIGFSRKPAPLSHFSLFSQGDRARVLESGRSVPRADAGRRLLRRFPGIIADKRRIMTRLDASVSQVAIHREGPSNGAKTGAKTRKMRPVTCR